MLQTYTPILDAIGRGIEAYEAQEKLPLELRVGQKVLSRIQEEAYLDTRRCYVEFDGWRVLWGLPVHVSEDRNCLVEVVC